MKILAVRGTNLASIPWFEIDLQKEPLASTRIFAITGPTGAGKSTLLDTIALALYDRAPRLVGARDTGGDESEVRGADPRAVMRRHSAEAAAEIDFVGQDGVRYRSTWEVWRAHRRSSGRMQSQKMTLMEIDSGRDISGATKTETLAQIEARVGLSFDEFRRAVLLAQGDFAAFLEARADERAELLEKMTGTRIYAELSRAAFARAKDEAAALDALFVKRDATTVLDDEVRAALEADREALGKKKAEVEAALEAAERAVAWHERYAALLADRDAARTKQRTTEEAWAAAEPDRELLAARERAERLAPSYRLYKDADRRVTEGERAIAKANDEAAAARTEAETAANALAAASRATTAIVDAIAQMAPDLDRARTLDAQIADATAEQTRAQTELEAADAHWRAEADRLRACLDEVERSRAAKAATDAYLAEHARIEPVVKLWPRWETSLAEAVRLRSLGEERAKQRVAFVAQRAALDEAGTAIREALEGAHAKAARAKAALTATDDALTGFRGIDSEDIADARSILSRRIQDLERLEAIPRETKKREKEAKDAADAANKEESFAKRRKAERKEARRNAKRLREKLTEAEAEFERAEAVRAVASRRAELLTAGHECPLCGSTEHPYEAEGPAPKRNARLKRKVKKLAADLERAKAIAEQSKETDAQFAERARIERARAETATREIELRVEEWAAKREALELVWTESSILAQRGLRRLALQVPESPHERRAAKEAEAVRRHLEEELVALEQLSGRGAKLLREQETNRAAVEAVTKAVATIDKELAEHTATVTTLDDRIAKIDEQENERRARLDELAAQLDLSDDSEWRRALLDDPEALAKTLSDKVRAWEEKRQASERERAAIVDAEREEQLTRAKHDAALEARKAVDARYTTRRERTEALVDQRKTLLEGRSVEQQSAANAAAKRQAEEALASRRSEAESTSRRDTSTAAHRDVVAKTLRDAEMERASLELELLGDLEDAGFEDLEALAALLERTDIEALAAKSAALADARTRAQTTAKDCQERLDRHVAGVEPTVAEEEVASALAAAVAHRATVRVDKDGLVEASGRAQEKLAADDAAKKLLEALAPKIAAQREEADRWAEINEVIGSSDGKKLRTFAQGLTLEVLLEQANLHLSQLRPRYRLRRVRAQDMELEVVDGDMADEVRTTSTLSGGERFLVSLALALGLSSLSSRNVKIESLFVDEGFGSLDRDALEVALATLDQLQSEGRTIGIISHMPEIAERVGYQIEVTPVAPGRSEVRVVER